jgi:tRNA modification GTPase
MRDTIFALATAAGRAAVAMVRISGPDAGVALAALAGRRPAARNAAVRKLRDDAGDLIDQALVLWFPGPDSYTGEDVAELHLHGGSAVVARVTAALLGLGLRLAEPGEFTRRAFEAGRLGLDQAEGVADLIDAETEAQARQAVAQLGGALGRRHAGWRTLLAEALAFLEAAVDFPDEELPDDVAVRAEARIARLRAELERGLGEARRGERVRDGYRIALVGAPNAGKSRLFNALLGRDAAIVTSLPGTTRDVIEAPVVMAGYKVLIADMAGLRETDDLVEGEGVRRAEAWAREADLRLWVVDGSGSDGAWAQAAGVVRAGDLIVVNKSDLAAGCDEPAAAARATEIGAGAVSLSAETGAGVAALRETLHNRVAAELAGAEFPAVTRERHARLLAEALAHLERAGRTLQQPELAAEDLRLAARSLERVTGRIGAEDVLDVIFSSFCIGK